ncbi:ABC transporter ATP-binding protein [soil metagenome]|nr:ABC transporter ATP-binding protein [Acidobacteriota bacterium]
MLQAADVVFGYGAEPVLRGVSLAVHPGEFVGILGPNGSGKTTLLKLLAGTLRPAGGTVRVDGVALSSIPRAALARRMAVVPQETHVAFDFSVLEIALMGRYPHLGAFEIEGPRDFEIARAALAATGTLQFQDRPFMTLSGGEKQRVVVATALAQIDPFDSRDRSIGQGKRPDAPCILLLDEPTAALDLRYQIGLASLLRELQARFPITIVVSTHDLNFAASVCRSLVLLESGRVLASGPLDDVLTPAHVRALYGVDADVQRHPASGRLVVVPLAAGEGAHHLQERGTPAAADPGAQA